MGNDLVIKSDRDEMAALALDSFDFKMKLVRFTIGQGSTQKGKVGHFNSETGDSLLKIEGVSFVGKFSSQVMYHGRQARAKNARCASDDGINPAARIENPINPVLAGGCADCPARVWSSDGSERDLFNSEMKAKLGRDAGHTDFDPKKPLCHYMENLVFIDKEGQPFELQVTKHNIKQVEKIEMILQMVALKARAPGYALAFDLWLTPVPGEGNRHLLNFSQSKDWMVLPLEIAKERVFMVKFLKKNASQLIASKHAEMDASHIREVSEPQGDAPF